MDKVKLILEEGKKIIAEQEARDEQMTDSNAAEREEQFLDGLEQGKVQVIVTTGQSAVQDTE